MKIAHITDLHLDEEFPSENGIQTRNRFDSILKDIESKSIKKVVCTGDIGEKESVPHFFEKLKNKSLSITLGNHDLFSEVIKYFKIGIHYDSQKLYSSEEQEHYKFIYLDSSEGQIDNQQLLWLRKELITTKPILIFIHHPILALNLKVDEIGALKNRSELLKLLENSANKIFIYCGHYHMENILVHKNITQNITPATSFQIKKKISVIEIDAQIYGYRIIDLQENYMSSKIQLLSDAN